MSLMLIACLFLNKNCMNKTGGKGTFKRAEQSELFSAMSDSGMSCRIYTIYAWQSERKKRGRKDTAGKM